MLTAVVILSMALAPLLLMATKWLPETKALPTTGFELTGPLSNSALVVGFGRVGQVVSQLLFARGYSISIIDTDVEMVETARAFGSNVYYGDGTRLDTLRTTGMETAGVVLVYTDDAEATTRIVELVKAAAPSAPVISRAVDRVHRLDLVKHGVDVEVRETFESAVALGRAALRRLGTTAHEVARIEADFRARDEQRFELERAGGVQAGGPLFRPDATTRASGT